MDKQIYKLFDALFGGDNPMVSVPQQQEEGCSSLKELKQRVVAFLGTLAPGHPAHKELKSFLESDRSGASRFFYEAFCQIEEEITAAIEHDRTVREALEQMGEVSDKQDGLWRVLFPEGEAVRSHFAEQVKAVRERREVEITRLNEFPIQHPAREMLFTSNILLTVPSASTPIDSLPYSDALKRALKASQKEKQRYWYDHPIPIGIAPQNNEILYGLNGLNEAVAYEKEQGNMPSEERALVLLSVTVTHPCLGEIAQQYLQEEFAAYGDFPHLDIFIFSEKVTQRIVKEVLQPAGEKVGVSSAFGVFGVDGEYGRHYSFLKAILPLWSATVDSRKRATFKIDLDQVFTQKELKNQTGKSAFEHFCTPLWGAQGRTKEGREVDFAMIAGSLINEKDFSKGIFTLDVKYDPQREVLADERIFCSYLPQAVSTEAEMGTRYRRRERIDGKSRVIRRIHVTGGTNGILGDRLLKHRLFTPSFIGRAEDQCYLLSGLANETLPAYIHQDGLIMRHDKEAFAGEAIKTAASGKLIGDYVRVLYFSAYARHLGMPFDEVKRELDPFTGCFVSRLPITVSHLRFAVKALTFQGSEEEHVGFISMGMARLKDARNFVRQEMAEQLSREREEWNAYYHIVECLLEGLEEERQRCAEILRSTQIVQ